MRIFEKTHIANGTTANVGVVVKDSPCVLRYVTVNTPSTGNITIYDSVSGTGNIVGIIKSVTDTGDVIGTTGTFRYDCSMTNGINIHTTTLADLTVVYEKI